MVGGSANLFPDNFSLLAAALDIYLALSSRIADDLIAWVPPSPFRTPNPQRGKHVALPILISTDTVVCTFGSSSLFSKKCAVWILN